MNKNSSKENKNSSSRISCDLSKNKKYIEKENHNHTKKERYKRIKKMTSHMQKLGLNALKNLKYAPSLFLAFSVLQTLTFWCFLWLHRLENKTSNFLFVFLLQNTIKYIVERLFNESIEEEVVNVAVKRSMKSAAMSVITNSTYQIADNKNLTNFIEYCDNSNESLDDDILNINTDLDNDSKQTIFYAS